MKTKIIAATLSVAALMSCSKEEQSVQKTYSSSVTSFKEMTVPQGFDFSGIKTIKVNLEKQEGISVGSKSLITIHDAEGSVLLKHNADLSQDTELALQVPSATKELYVVNAAGIQEAIRIVNNRLTIK